MGKIEFGIAELPSIVSTVWRRRILFSVSTVIPFVISSAIILSLPPRYSADAMLLLPSTFLPSSSLGELTARPLEPTNDQIVMRNEVEILRSDLLSRKVIERLDLANEPEFRRERRGLIGWVMKHLQA